MTSTEGSTVRFSSRTPVVRPAAIRRFARVLESKVSKGGYFDCLITSSHALRRMNRDWRGKDQVTDVLSFPVQDGLQRSRFLGDIAISEARARMQARAYGHSVETEIYILMLHGLLHLMGLDHETDSGRMARLERRFRGQLGLPVGLIERAAEAV